MCDGQTGGGRESAGQIHYLDQWCLAHLDFVGIQKFESWVDSSWEEWSPADISSIRRCVRACRARVMRVCFCFKTYAKELS